MYNLAKALKQTKKYVDKKRMQVCSVGKWVFLEEPNGSWHGTKIFLNSTDYGEKFLTSLNY
jgi:hypothetical protein